MLPRMQIRTSVVTFGMHACTQIDASRTMHMPHRHPCKQLRPVCVNVYVFIQSTCIYIYIYIYICVCVCVCLCGDVSVLVGFCMSMHVCICTSVNALGLRSWNESVDYAYISRSICRLFVYGYMCMRSFAYLVLLSHPLSCLSDHAFASLLHFSARIITMCMGMSRHTGPSPKPSTVRA